MPDSLTYLATVTINYREHAHTDPALGQGRTFASHYYAGYHGLLTMVMARATVTDGMVDRALEPLRQRLLATRIARCEVLNRAQTEDHPRDVAAYARQSRAAKDYQQLTQEVLTLWAPH